MLDPPCAAGAWFSSPGRTKRTSTGQEAPGSKVQFAGRSGRRWVRGSTGRGARSALPPTPSGAGDGAAAELDAETSGPQRRGTHPQNRPPEPSGRGGRGSGRRTRRRGLRAAATRDARRAQRRGLRVAVPGRAAGLDACAFGRRRRVPVPDLPAEAPGLTWRGKDPAHAAGTFGCRRKRAGRRAPCRGLRVAAGSGATDLTAEAPGRKRGGRIWRCRHRLRARVRTPEPGRPRGAGVRKPPVTRGHHRFWARSTAGTRWPRDGTRRARGSAAVAPRPREKRGAALKVGVSVADRTGRWAVPSPAHRTGVPR